MILEQIPWLALALLSSLAGAAAAAVAKTPQQAQRLCIGWLVASLAFAAAASAVAQVLTPGAPAILFGVFAVDAVAAPLLPVVGLLHLLSCIGTAKSRVTSALCVRLLLSSFIAVAAVTSRSNEVLVALMAAAALLPVWDLGSRGRSVRGYLLYLAPALGAMAVGLALMNTGSSPLGVGLMLAGLLIYAGVAPGHSWLPSLFAAGGFGSGLVFILPLLPVLAAVRIVLPQASDAMMAAAGFACLFTGLYAGGMAVVQQSARRFFAYLGLSQLSLVMFGVMQHTAIGITAALCLWISAALSLAGLAFPIRALEARFGDLSLGERHGYYAQAPALAICFLIAGLGCVGFPGTIGFVPIELLVSGSLSQGLWVSATLTVVATLNAIAILRAYFALFTGRRTTISVSLQATGVERLGIAIVVVAVLVGVLLSPSMVASRQEQADQLLRQRQDDILLSSRGGEPSP